MPGKLPPYAVAESDGTPTVYQPWKIIFPNGTITDVGDGTVYVGIGTSIQTTTSITVSTYDVRTPVLASGTVLFFLTNGTIGTFLNGAGGYTSVYDARSPILSVGTVLSIRTDGSATNFLNGIGLYSMPSGITQLVYAPSGSTYIVQTNDAVLSNEQVLAALSTGLMKNTAVTGVLTIAVSGTDYQVPLSMSSPIIYVGNTVGIQPSATNQDGYLSQSNFNLFNAKASTATTINTVAPLAGGGDLSANRILSLTTDGLTTTFLRGDGTYKSVYEARTPLLSAGTVLSILTDGSTTNFLRGDGTLAVPSSNSGVKIILFTVYSDDSWVGESVPIGQVPFETPITIRQVNVTTNGSSPTAAFNIEQRVWGSLATSGTGLFSVNQTATTTGFEATSFTSSNLAAKSHVFLTVSAVTIGQMDYITGSIYYSRNSI